MPPPDFPAEPPEIGIVVDVTLSTSSVIRAYWDGTQWWAGLNDEPNDAPIANEFVTSWAAIS